MEKDIVPGVSVTVPFGGGERTVRGYVLSVSETPVIEESRIRDIISVNRTVEKGKAEEELLRLAFWIKNHYGGTLSQALKVVFPIRKSVRERKRVNIIPLKSPEELIREADISGRKHYTARERVLRALAGSGEIDASLLSDKLNISKAVLKALEEKGFIRLETLREYRNPGIRRGEKSTVTAFSDEQRRIYESFTHDYALGLRDTLLIRGVTGSGKTLLYIEMIDFVVRRGKQAIMLIPEIALTFQTVMRFHERFGDRVSYMHSRLSPGERYDQYERARTGGIDVMIGPRSALFTPFNDLGIIIIDEEHESSYKADNMPKYHSRETAKERAANAGASLILGSATPSIDAEYRARRGEYRLFTMTRRPTGGSLPKVSIVDLRDELRKGNRSMFSLRLRELIGDRLRKHEQIMLFLNRRGYSGFVSCRSCGHVMKCPHCDVSLTSHRNGYLTCHYCGYREKAVKLCPECGSKYIGGMRAGTEQIEEGIRKLFPEAGILRMDGDSVRHKDDYDRILSDFKDHKADILIGTQMIVKGHDFPLVTLVGIILADLSLNSSDFRSAERTFDLLTQAAGRAGRGESAGEVVIQTYEPEHYSIEAAAQQDYNMFYSKEIMFRELMSYPPVSHLLKVLIEGRNEEAVKKEAERLALLAGKSFSGGGRLSGEEGSSGEERLSGGGSLSGEEGSSVEESLSGGEGERPRQVIGPAPDVISKIKDVFRQVFYVRDADYGKLTEIREKIENNRRDENRYETYVSYDFDPL